MKTIFTFFIVLVSTVFIDAQHKMFRHTAADNGQNYTMIDNPLLNGKPDARPIVANFGGNISFTTQILGVFYNETLQKWGIYNENLLPMSANHEFTIYVPSPEFSFTHVADINYFSTEINHQLMNGKPDVFAVMTHVIGGVYSNQPVSFFYNDVTTDGKWNIVDEDLSQAIPSGTTFFVATEGEQGIVKHRHIVTDPNEGYSTSVYHPLMANADACFVWSHNAGNGDDGHLTELESSTQAWFSDPFWRIAMEDLSDIPVGTVFDFLIYDPNAMSTADLSGKSSIQASPNPISDLVNFNSKNLIQEISIYDISGKQILNSIQNSTQSELNVSALLSGIYFAKIKTDKGQETIKLIKK